MKAKLILFVTALFIFNVVAIAQTQKQQGRNTSRANNTSSQKNKTKAVSGSNLMLDSLLIKSPKTKGKQGGQQ